MSIPVNKIVGASSKNEKNKMKHILQSFPDHRPLVVDSFRENILKFLEECCELEEDDYKICGMPTWSSFLVDQNARFLYPLYIIEESVKNSQQKGCDHCQYSGWSRHFLFKRKYHFIIPIHDKWNNEDLLSQENHILYGLIHCNGFGHLLCINGIEGGSNFISGSEVMGLWDRICNNLNVRKISLVDTSRKKQIKLRLLYTWFGNWGYAFYKGSYGVTKDKYEEALQNLSTLRLDMILPNSQDSPINKIVTRYSSLTNTPLPTIRALFKFMLALKISDPQINFSEPNSTSENKPNKKQPPSKTLSDLFDDRWPAERVEHTANIVVDVLKEQKKAITRQELREAAISRRSGDTGLLDSILKRLDDVIVRDCVVRRAKNPCSGLLEYSIQQLTENIQSAEKSVIPVDKPVSGSNLYGDLAYLFDKLFPESESDVGISVKTISNANILMKAWPFTGYRDDAYLRYICRVIPTPELSWQTILNNSHGEEVV